MFTLVHHQSDLTKSRIDQLRQEEGNEIKIQNLEKMKMIYNTMLSIASSLQTLQSCPPMNTIFHIITALKDHHYNLNDDKSKVKTTWGDVTLHTPSDCYPSIIFFETSSNKLIHQDSIFESIKRFNSWYMPFYPFSTLFQKPSELWINHTSAPQMLHIFREEKNIQPNEEIQRFGKKYNLRSVLQLQADYLNAGTKDQKGHVRTRIKAQNGNWFIVDGAYVEPEEGGQENRDKMKPTSQILIYERD